jgi:hypothetical protein
LQTAHLGQPEFYELGEWETGIITHGVSQGWNKLLSSGLKI